MFLVFLAVPWLFLLGNCILHLNHIVHVESTPVDNFCIRMAATRLQGCEHEWRIFLLFVLFKINVQWRAQGRFGDIRRFGMGWLPTSFSSFTYKKCSKYLGMKARSSMAQVWPFQVQGKLLQEKTFATRDETQQFRDQQPFSPSIVLMSFSMASLILTV